MQENDSHLFLVNPTQQQEICTMVLCYGPEVNIKIIVVRNSPLTWECSSSIEGWSCRSTCWWVDVFGDAEPFWKRKINKNLTICSEQINENRNKVVEGTHTQQEYFFFAIKISKINLRGVGGSNAWNGALMK